MGIKPPAGYMRRFTNCPPSLRMIRSRLPTRSGSFHRWMARGASDTSKARLACNLRPARRIRQVHRCPRIESMPGQSFLAQAELTTSVTHASFRESVKRTFQSAAVRLPAVLLHRDNPEWLSFSVELACRDLSLESLDRRASESRNHNLGTT
jgi:hypothetical protein